MPISTGWELGRLLEGEVATARDDHQVDHSEGVTG